MHSAMSLMRRPCHGDQNVDIEQELRHSISFSNFCTSSAVTGCESGGKTTT